MLLVTPISPGARGAAHPVHDGSMCVLPDVTRHFAVYPHRLPVVRASAS